MLPLEKAATISTIAGRFIFCSLGFEDPKVPLEWNMV